MILDKSVLIAQVLNKSAVLDQSEIDMIAPIFKSTCIKKGDFFIRAGMDVKEVAFVASGILRRTMTNEQGKEVVMQFFTEDHFFGDLDAYFRRKPSGTNIQAVTNCHLLTLSFNDLDQLRNKKPKFTALLHFISEEAMYERLHTEELMRRGSTIEKYQHFLNEYSKWALRIPLKDIASFLQIPPQMLSQIENNYERLLKIR